jgi:hypothetical protein
MSTITSPYPLEKAVLDQIYASEAYLVPPAPDSPYLKYFQDKDLCFQPPGNTLDRWLDLSA